MTRNVGTIDRAGRAVAGLGAIVVALVVGMTSAVGIVLMLVAALLLVTAAVGFCPLYRVLGLRTTGADDHGTVPVRR